jgi:CheY-like chemotaxis protein
MQGQSESDVQNAIVERLASMGIRTKLMQGGRCVLASMRFEPAPLETLTGELEVSEVVFATVGRDKIKCLRPQPLFQLPLIQIADCRNSTSIEARIRHAWQKRLTLLRSAASWLEQSGAARVERSADGTALRIPVAGEDRRLWGQVEEARKIILPSGGPLAGVTLRAPGDRVLEVDPNIHSSVDLEIAVTTRLEELARMDARLRDDERRNAMRSAKSPRIDARVQRKHRIMLVGPRITREHRCIDSLRLRNYDVFLANDQTEAAEFFDRMSPELVIADMNLGRSDGIELVPTLQSLVGIEDLPILLVDTHAREPAREAARRAGAAGYLTYPIDVAGIARRLQSIVGEPRRRRFTRFPQQLSVQIGGSPQPCTATHLGRGGLFLRTHHELEPRSLHNCEIELDEIGQTLRVQAQVLYTISMRNLHGVGTRFHGFQPDHEPLLIEYLRNISAS